MSDLICLKMCRQQIPRGFNYGEAIAPDCRLVLYPVQDGGGCFLQYERGLRPAARHGCMGKFRLFLGDWYCWGDERDYLI